MKNCQQALNFETLRSTLGKSASVVMPVFDEISKRCDTSQLLAADIKLYSEVAGVQENILQNQFLRTRALFERVSDSVVVIGRDSPLWPKGVDQVPFLYLCGDCELLGMKGISVVGTRHPSDWGMSMTREAVSVLDREFAIVSGLAMGIDGVAHIQALADGKKTIAVIGTPIDQVYPKEHERLQKLISEKGLVVSRFAPGTEVQRYFFMQRNLLMSQISEGTLIVESTDGGGGIREAEYSAKQGKPVYAMKETYNNRTYLWPRTFKGLKVVSNASEIIEDLKTERKKVEIQPELF